jgi:hypothetical protein
MKNSKKKKLDKFLEETKEEEKYLGKYYNKYKSEKLIIETKSLKNATWFMAFATFTLVVFSLAGENFKGELLNILITLSYILAIALAIPIFVGILWGIIKNFIGKKK